MTERRHRRYTASDGSEWLIEVSLDERYGNWPRSRWKRDGDNWIMDGIGSSGGITDPDEALDREEEYIEYYRLRAAV